MGCFCSLASFESLLAKTTLNSVNAESHSFADYAMTECEVKEDALSQTDQPPSWRKKDMVLILGGRQIAALLLGFGVDLSPK